MSTFELRFELGDASSQLVNLVFHRIAEGRACNDFPGPKDLDLAKSQKPIAGLNEKRFAVGFEHASNHTAMR